MNIQIVGLNHKTAPINIRERFSFDPQRLNQALTQLSSCACVEENMILSTCNRTEVYAVIRDKAAGSDAVISFLSSFHGLEPADFRSYLYTLTGKDAVRHLFRVAASLDSMIVGETQILGQVKDALLCARAADTVGKNLNSLLEEALRVGKKVRTETQIGKGAVSVTTAAIELARKIFETLDGKKVMIIGAGKIGEMTVKNLYSRGVSSVMVSNRTFTRAKELAGIFGGTAVPFEKFLDELENTDIVISSTSAPHYIINSGHIIRAMRRRSDVPLFLIDLGLPRNIEPKINAIENVYLYNIDDLAQVADANMKERQNEARKAEEIISACVEQAIRQLPFEEQAVLIR